MKYYLSLRCDTDGYFSIRNFEFSTYKRFGFHNKSLLLYIVKVMSRNNVEFEKIQDYFFILEFDRYTNNFRLCMFKNHGSILAISILFASLTIHNLVRSLLYDKFYTVKTISDEERLDMIWLYDTFTDKDVLFSKLRNDKWSQLSNQVLTKVSEIRK